MNFNMNNNDKFKPIRTLCCVGPTGPTGPAGGPTGSTGPTGPTGATHTLISESKIYFYRHFFNIMA